MGRDRGLGAVPAADPRHDQGGLAAVEAESDDVERAFAEALRAGTAPDSEQAMDLAEEHRQQISRNFYDCGPEMHAGLGQMYADDERFTAYYERIAPGLAQYVSTAVQANAARHV